jgi:hypothetical protein
VEEAIVSTLSIEIPQSVLLASGQSREEFVRDAKFLLAAKHVYSPNQDVTAGDPRSAGPAPCGRRAG